MPFDLAAAGFAMGMGLSMLFGPADKAPQSTRNALTFGTALQPWRTLGGETIVTLTHRPQGNAMQDFAPIYSAGLSNQGMAFVSVGLGRPLDIGGLKVMPYIGPALLRSAAGSTAVQLRTGFDISQSFDNGISVTGGVYHIGNGQNNASSANITVAHLGILMKF
jgi:hypothetical protein